MVFAIAANSEAALVAAATVSTLIPEVTAEKPASPTPSATSSPPNLAILLSPMIHETMPPEFGTLLDISTNASIAAVAASSESVSISAVTSENPARPKPSITRFAENTPILAPPVTNPAIADMRPAPVITSMVSAINIVPSSND